MSAEHLRRKMSTKKMSASGNLTSIVTAHGGCHCGAVKFQVSVPESVKVLHCNCSICTKKANDHFIVPAGQFQLIRGEDSLTTYTFNTHKAKHQFCKVCGVQSFYLPRSNPGAIAVTPHSLHEEDRQKLKITVENVDGQNWESKITNPDTFLNTI